MKFGCCTDVRNYEELVACGYDFIELSGHAASVMEEQNWKEFVKRVEGTGIPCIGFNDYCHGEPAVVGERFDPAAVRDYAQRLLDRGAQVGIQNVGIGAPLARRLPEGYSMERADEQCVRFLEITTEEAAKRGIRVLFEAVHANMCNYATLTEDAVRLIRAVGAENLFMVLDFYHMEVMGEDRLDIERYMPLIRHLHYSTCGEGYSRGYPTEEHRSDLQAILKRVQALGYHGSFSLEAPTMDFAGEATRALTILRQAAEA